jgi:hypothetical protein
MPFAIPKGLSSLRKVCSLLMTSRQLRNPGSTCHAFKPKGDQSVGPTFFLRSFDLLRTGLCGQIPPDPSFDYLFRARAGPAVAVLQANHILEFRS